MVHTDQAMADEPKGRQYSTAEVEEILRRALERPTERGLTREELLVVAREAGISEESIEAAADDVDRSQNSRAVVERLKRDARVGFVRHLTSFAIVNLGLFMLNLATNLATTTDQVPHWWFLFPLFGWGIGLGFHAARLRSRGEPSDAEVQSLMAQEAEVRAREEASRKAESFEQKVEQGVEAVLARLERVLTTPAAPSAQEVTEVRVSDEAPPEEREAALTENNSDDEQRRERRG